MRLMAGLLRKGHYADEVTNILAMEEMQKMNQEIEPEQLGEQGPSGGGKKFRRRHGGKAGQSGRSANWQDEG